MADELLALVLAGTKTATCSPLSEYQAEREPIGEVGRRSVVLDGRGRPACVIETCEVAIKRFDKVDAAFAYDEGEGDRSLACWRREHELLLPQIRLVRRGHAARLRAVPAGHDPPARG